MCSKKYCLCSKKYCLKTLEPYYANKHEMADFNKLIQNLYDINAHEIGTVKVSKHCHFLSATWLAIMCKNHSHFCERHNTIKLMLGNISGGNTSETWWKRFLWCETCCWTGENKKHYGFCNVSYVAEKQKLYMFLSSVTCLTISRAKIFECFRIAVCMCNGSMLGQHLMFPSWRENNLCISFENRILNRFIFSEWWKLKINNWQFFRKFIVFMN